VIISTWFLPATFIFGTTAKDTFVSLVFLFVRHPFSVGDRIQVDSTQYIVEEMNIMDTTLLQ
jgi:small-conductance mechanosensitive channel